MRCHWGVAVFAAAFVFARADAQVWSPDKSAIADQYGNFAVNPSKALTPSLSVGVSINGSPVFLKGYGNVSPGGPPATGDTIYRIGSLSKQITAAGVLTLIENLSGPIGPGGTSPAGAQMALDDPLTKFIPEAAPWSKTPVTLRNVLNMQSGFATYTSPPGNVAQPFPPTKPVRPDELMRFVASMLFANPSPGGGLGYSYSNTNYFLLANVIERALRTYKQAPFGYSYQNWIRGRIFEPAGMSETSFIEDTLPAGAPFAPPPYDTSASAYSNPAWPKGAGEVRSSVRDLLRWHSALMGQKFFGPQALLTMFTPPANSNYAMGWIAAVGNNYGWYVHNGVIPGYVGYDGIFSNFKSGQWVSVALLANNDNVPLSVLAACLAQLAMDPSTSKAGLGKTAKAACGV